MYGSLSSIVSWGQVSSTSLETMTLQSKWLSTMNSKERSSLLYNETSGLYVNDSLCIGPSAIQNALYSQIAKVGTLVQYDTIASYQIHQGNALVLGTYTTAKGLKVSSIIGWRKGEAWIKAFEVMGERSVQLPFSKADIDLMRSSWELYSNQHRPDLIVQNVFAANGRYFYNGIEYKGEQITEAYGYMGDASYAIDLTPKKVYQVSDSLIYEIGIYRTTGEGLYFLLWVKEGDSWKLLLDFNF
jgi:hypothetical protein